MWFGTSRGGFMQLWVIFLNLLTIEVIDRNLNLKNQHLGQNIPSGGWSSTENRIHHLMIMVQAILQFFSPCLLPWAGSSFSGWKRRIEYLSLAVSCLEPGYQSEIQRGAHICKRHSNQVTPPSLSWRQRVKVVFIIIIIAQNYSVWYTLVLNYLCFSPGDSKVPKLWIEFQSMNFSFQKSWASRRFRVWRD